MKPNNSYFLRCLMPAGRTPSYARLIFHVDMDAFYASIEQLEHPEYRGKPLIVGGVGSNRGVVSAASYEARVFGVHSAMPVAQARQRCPHGIFVPVDMNLYAGFSRRVMDCLSEFTPVLEQLSVDEAFLEMTGTERSLGPPLEVGKRIKDYIRLRTGLPASVGIAPNKFLAKLASEHGKPDGLVEVHPDRVQAFLDPLAVGKLWGVGKRHQAALQMLGVYTVKQVRLYPPAELKAHFGEAYGKHLEALSRGEDSREVVQDIREKSISNEMTLETDISDAEEIQNHLLELSDRVGRRARKEGLAGKTVSFVWRDPDFSRHSRSLTLSQATHDSQIIYATVKSHLEEVMGTSRSESRKRKFRLLGVKLSHFHDFSQQLSLFSTTPDARLDRAMDAVRDRFGDDSISRAVILGNHRREAGHASNPTDRRKAT